MTVWGLRTKDNVAHFCLNWIASCSVPAGVCVYLAKISHQCCIFIHLTPNSSSWKHHEGVATINNKNPNVLGHLATKVVERNSFWIILYISLRLYCQRANPTNIRDVEWRVLLHKVYKCLVSFHGLLSFAFHYCERLPDWLAISGPVFPTLIYLPNEYLKL